MNRTDQHEEQPIRADLRRVNALMEHAYDFRERLANDLKFVEAKIDSLYAEKSRLTVKLKKPNQ